MNATVLLEVTQLSVKYGAVEAVTDLSLSINRGTVVSLVGPNGAGKSSFIGAVCGIVPKTSVAVVLNGEDISSLPTHAIARRGVALVPEGRRLFPEMSVLDNLLTSGQFVQGEPHRKELLEQVYEHFPILRRRRSQLARSLSGGEQQMLAIGRGLMADPQLLILDEPSLGLAPLLVREIFRVFRTLQEHGHTILLVEQNVRQSLQIADYAYVVESGRIFLEGSGSSVAADPHVKHAYLGVV